MKNYEPELMYALDSKSEYSDWKNVYNVSGSDVLYCPICLGRVKLWNGQDHNKIYKKQKCFHHIDGMCLKESKIHFAYKTWLLEHGSKFKVDNKVYEVKTSEIEKTLYTEFGNYRPDIIVETICGEIFYIEISNTNKKTYDYITKWDKLGHDVLELDINDQLVNAVNNKIPEFNIIYSSKTGECYIKQYIRQDYDLLITSRKIYWKRKDLLAYKIKWEQLDYFWQKLQLYYANEVTLDMLIEAFTQIESEDQKFICQHMKGKHSTLRKQLEKHYTSKLDLESAHLKHISSMIKKLNQEFGYNSCDVYDDTCLLRKNKEVTFKNTANSKNNNRFYIYDDTTENDIYNYCHPIMEDFYNKNTIKYRDEIKKKKILQKSFCDKYLTILDDKKNKINNSKSGYWKMEYTIKPKYSICSICITLLDKWDENIDINMNEQIDLGMNKDIAKVMNRLLYRGKQGYCDDTRIMEVK